MERSICSIIIELPILRTLPQESCEPHVLCINNYTIMYIGLTSFIVFYSRHILNKWGIHTIFYFTVSLLFFPVMFFFPLIFPLIFLVDMFFTGKSNVAMLDNAYQEGRREGYQEGLQEGYNDVDNRIDKQEEQIHKILNILYNDNLSAHKIATLKIFLKDEGLMFLDSDKDEEDNFDLNDFVTHIDYSDYEL